MNEGQADEYRQAVLGLLRLIAERLGRKVPAIPPAKSLRDPGEPLGPPLKHWKRAS